MNKYYRPILQTGTARPNDAVVLAGGWCWFTHVEVMTRDSGIEIAHVGDIPAAKLTAFTRSHSAMSGLQFDQPSLMGILNVTPDSFSDGGRFLDPDSALVQARLMATDGADILDIGGESTRPGAAFVSVDEEVSRTAGVIKAITDGLDVPVSIDTRKAAVAQSAIAAGAAIVNDVSAMSYDPQMAETMHKNDVPVILMHAQGSPDTMQNAPSYNQVTFDVYDYLAERVDAAIKVGISSDKIIVDPGIGFGKTLEHNVELLRNIAVFHGLGCPILLGASRKKFIGTLSNEPEADKRGYGTAALTLAAIAQGVQIHRVHDIREIQQAVTLWKTATGMDLSDG